MPLRDHFRPPLDDLRHREGFHATWPVMIVALLRRKLPRRYFAEPRAHSGSSHAAACRLTKRADEWRLETWAQPLALGGPLPIMPLWLADDLAVPLELEDCYEQSCSILNIP